MIKLPQDDEEEIEKQNFISSRENEKKQISSVYIMIFKSILLIIIIIILITSYFQKKKKPDNVIEKIPENKDNNENTGEKKEEHEKIKDEKNKITQEEEIEDSKKEEKNKKTQEEENKDNKKKEKESIKKNTKTDLITDIVSDENENISKIPNIKYDLSLIINSFNKNFDFISLIKSILSKNIDNSEVIFSTNYKIDNNLLKQQEEECKKRNISIKSIEYDEKINSLKMKIDSASKAIGSYIVFINPEEILSLDIFNNYKQYIKDNIDIIQYDLDYDRIGNNIIIYQPQLYESLFFSRDSFDFNHFHVNGKLYKTQIFIDATKYLDKLYLEQSDKYYDDIMIICLVFQKANTFKKLRGTSSCNRNKCQRYQFKRYNYNKEILKDTVLFLKFLFEYTGVDKVQEKRMAAKIFNELLISRRVNSFYNDALLNLVKDTINLYLNSDLINDIDKNPIQNYRNNIKI